MKKWFLCAVPFFIFSMFSSCATQLKNSDHARNILDANVLLDNFHHYAAEADFNYYFDLFAEESTFIGTDATEVWNKRAFMDYAKPHFDKGKAWTFKTVQRNLQESKDGKIIWFDELLETQMKLCRGSGVLEKNGNEWKIRQYVLSMTVPNDVTREVVKAKAPIEDQYIENLKK